MKPEKQKDEKMETNKIAKPEARPRRYSMYDQMNINPKWLDVFIIAMVVLLLLAVVWGIK